MRSILIAVGGNSLIRAGEKGTIAEQLANARRTAAAVVGLIRDGFRIVITHGNGPQVGAQLLRSERASDLIPGQTLDVCGAASQGEIGYLLAQSLQDELAVAGVHIPVVSIVTQTVVSPTDPALSHPTKPIGPFYSAPMQKSASVNSDGKSSKTRLVAIGESSHRLSQSRSSNSK